MRNLLALTFVVAMSALIMALNHDDSTKAVSLNAPPAVVLQNVTSGAQSDESADDLKNTMASSAASPIQLSEPQDIGPTSETSEKEDYTEADRLSASSHDFGPRFALGYVNSEAGPHFADWLMSRWTHLADEALLDDLDTHVRRVNDFNHRVYYLANWSDVSGVGDPRINELGKSFSRLDGERKELAGRLLASFADFDGGYDQLVGSTILPAWKVCAFNTAGLEKAMRWRGGSSDCSDIPDLSRPEVDAELTAYILSVE